MLGKVLQAFGADRSRRSAAAVPAGRCVYAIGDIHGRADLLARMHDMILADADAAPEADKVVVYLGDYVDRGLSSREVIDLLIDAPLPGFRSVHLCGNHEAMMLDFLQTGRNGPMWLYNGGDATLHSYGIAVPAGFLRGGNEGECAEALRAAVPPRHVAFLEGLETYHLEGDYCFVHAGLRPGVPLEEQEQGDLIWIRDEFLQSDADFGHVVVHGHTITGEIDQRDNRIGIDTGAYGSGRLTCLALQGTGRRFLQT